MLRGFLSSNLNLLFLFNYVFFYLYFLFYGSSWIFSWIILSLSLHYNKTVWHVLVNKMIVSLIISHTAVCASLYFWLHYKPDMISHFFPLFLSSQKWRQEICCMITNWRENVHHGISLLIQYFSIRFYILVSFYGNIFSPSCLSWKVLWIWWYIWNFLKIKSILN